MFRPILFTALLMGLAAPASALTARNGMRVSAIDAQTFTVHYPSPDGETQYLCAAGDYVIRALGLPASTRIYRASPSPRKQGQGITFTLDEARKVRLALVTQFGRNKGDGGISAGVARDVYCPIIRLFPNF